MISKILSYGTKALNYGYRGLKASPALLFTENGAKELTKGFYNGIKAGTTGKESVKLAFKTGGKALEAAGKGGVFKNIWQGVKSLPGTVSKGWKVGARAAKIAGKSQILGSLKGAFKGASKAIPGVGNLLMFAFALPTICSAFKDEGIWGGVKEIAKEGTKLGGAAIGAAIGSAICPGIGSLVGWIAGDWIAGLFTGKSHSEKKAEQEEQQQQQMAMAQAMQQQGIQPGVDQLQTQPTQTNPFETGSQSTYLYGNPYKQFNAVA